jgi:hypothetical protein
MRGVPSSLPRAARRPARHPVLRLAALTAAAALGLSGGLAGCSSDPDSPEPAAGSSSSSSPSGSSSDVSGSSSPSSQVSVPPGLELTAPGTELSFAERANVAFESARRQRTVLQLSVRRVQQGRLSDFAGFILPERYRRDAAYYYATVSVRNVGTGDLGGAAVPLLGVNSANTLLPPVSFTTRYARCPSRPLPAKFPPGTSVSTCLVYLALDGTRLTSVSYRPSQGFNPITWTGDIQRPPAVPKRAGRQPKPGKGG